MASALGTLAKLVDSVVLYPIEFLVTRLRSYIQQDASSASQASLAHRPTARAAPLTGERAPLVAPDRDEENPAPAAKKTKNPPTVPRKQIEPPPTVNFQIIGKVESAYQGKFGAPRQGVLVPDGRGVVALNPRAIDVQSSLSDLDQGFSHLWILFIFHDNKEGKHSLRGGKVRPPQAQGTRIGVFASRSPHRPNPIGLTLAKITRVDAKMGKVYVSGLDLVDGTPILDIKPFVQHADGPAAGDEATTPPWVLNPKFDLVPVHFSPEASASLQELLERGNVCKYYTRDELPALKRAIEQFVSIDPRDLSRGRGEFKGTPRTELPSKILRKPSRVGGVADSLTAITYVDFDGLTVAFRVSEQYDRGFEIVSITKIEPRVAPRSLRAADA